MIRRTLCFLFAFIMLSGESASADPDPNTAYTIGSLFTDYSPIFATSWADINGDGDLDIVLNDHLYENDGMGNYTLKWSSPDLASTTTQISTFVRSTAWGDCDGDGDLDLAVGVDGINYIYRNTGAFTFDSPTWASSAGHSSRSVQWGDGDGDGDLDLAVGNYATNNQLYVNDGDCGFSEQAIATATDPTTAVAWADADGDSDLDLAIGNDGAANSILLNDGSGGFVAGWHSADTKQTTSLAWGDMDADGDFDLIVGHTISNSNGDSNQLYRNHGDGTFAIEDAGMGGHIRRTQSVDVGDLDLDGDLDIAIGNKDQFNDVYANDGNGVFTWVWQPPDDGRWTHHIAIGDGDSDGDLDLLVGNNEDAQLYLNDSNSGWAVYHEVAPDDSTYAMAWGDIDGDGDLDLALGNGKNQNPYDGIHNPDSEPNHIYINDGTGALSQLPFTTDLQDTHALAWGDADGDGDLDLAVGNVGAANQLYRNDGNLTFTILPLGAETLSTYALAWGDADGDGDLDLAVGNEWASNHLYINLGDLNFAPPIIIGETHYENTKAVSWGDMDRDGDLDLAIGNHRGPNRIYANIGNAAFSEVWASAESIHTTSLDWGDADGDGDLDLAVGNERAAPNELYTNEGNNNFSSAFISADLFNTRAIQWGDSDNDGDLDLAIANGHPYVAQVNQLFENDGAGNFAHVWESADHLHRSYAAEWVDVDSDGDLDLSFGNWDATTQILENTLFSAPLLPDNLPSVVIDFPNGASAMSAFYSVDIITTPTITIPFHLIDHESETVHRVQGFYSMDGGDHWQPAVSTTPTTDLATSPTGVSHTFVWDTLQSGLFGQSDQVVFRLEIVLHAEGDTYTYPDIVAYPHQRASIATTTQPFRVRGTQIQVVDDALNPIIGASVMRVPAGATSGDYISDANGVPFQTDVQGDLQGRGALGLGDSIVAMLPVSVTESYTAYHLSAAPFEAGLVMDEVEMAGVQEVVVSADNRLLVFDLTVSLEWDARHDPAFLTQLEDDLQRTGEILYDLTNGQATVGDVTVYHAREQWNHADLVIHASNTVRPSAIAGGVVMTATHDVSADGTPLQNAYVPGQIRMGATWNRFGEAGSTLGEDWARTLAHELGHYLFFLPDNYLGINPDSGLLSLVDCVGSAMTDPYSDDYSEFLTNDTWNGNCLNTLAEAYMGRDDWETIRMFYPLLDSTTTNSGPSYLPLNLTNVQFSEPLTPTAAFVDPFFSIVSETGSALPIANGRGEAFLIKTNQNADPTDDYVQALGSPVGNIVHARGTVVDDRLCVYDYSRTPLHFGCVDEIGNVTTPITLQPIADWQPEIRVTEVNSQTFSITVTGVSESSLMVQVLPSFGAASAEIPMTSNGDDFTQTVTLPEPAFGGYVRVWVPSSNREMIVDFISIEEWGGKALSWGGKALSWGGKALSWGGKALSWGAPTLSSDGQVSLFPHDNPFADTTVYNLQKLSFLPTLDAWLTPIGQAYRVEVEGDMPASSIIFRYLGRDVDHSYEDDLAVYFSADNAQTWQRLPTEVDITRNHAVAAAAMEGIYTLALTVESAELYTGWNNVAYIVQTTRPVTIALVSIDGAYTSVYWRDDADPDRWLLYDSTVAPPFDQIVNTLEWIGPDAYWIYATQPATWYVGIEGQPRRASTRNSTILAPPATFYGWIDVAEGEVISAEIDGNPCGQTTAVAIDGQIAFSLQVRADNPFGQSNGCGLPNRTVTFLVDGVVITEAAWNHTQAQQLDLEASVPTNITLYNGAATARLPIVFVVTALMALLSTWLVHIHHVSTNANLFSGVRRRFLKA